MERVHTKEMAEALLRELPSVLGAFVREDVNGHPREVHLLVSPGPNVKLLAQDVRDMLEEKLGVPVDYRVISIAQLAEDVVDFSMEPEVEPADAPGEPRVRFLDVTSEVREQRVRVRARLQCGDAIHEGEGVELDVGNGRLRAAAIAVLKAAISASTQSLRLELEAVSVIKAFDREYVLVSAVAGAAAFGRKLVPLVGAHPIELDLETAGALGTLKAINRVLAKVLA